MITLSLNILDIVQNSIRAGASEISAEITESKLRDTLIISITDNGSGIDKTILDKVTDPFFTTRTTRKTGMGLPLLKHHANMAGGDLKIVSEVNKGTRVTATFSLTNIDRQPLGDIAGVLIILIASNPEINFLYTHKTDIGKYRFSSRETQEFLGADTLNDYELLKMVKEMINGNLRDIGVSDSI